MEKGLLALAAALLAVPVAAQEVPLATAPPPPALPATGLPAIDQPIDMLPSAALPDEATLTLGESQTRMTVPVRIDTRGPWNFIVDTGAERTVVSRELAGVLGLAAGPFVRVTAMTGTERVATVLVPSLSVSTLVRDTIVSPALGAHDLGAVGMVGIDALQGHAVVIDFDRKRMTLRPSKKRARGPRVGYNDVVVIAKSLYGQLIVTDAHWRGKRIAVVVDTGTPMSVGNPALFQLMRNARPAGSVSLVSATGGVLYANAVTVSGIEVGGIGFSNISMAIADAAPFQRFGLTDTPALLMGMDLLRLFRGVQIDFANREIRFTLPRGAIVPGAGISGV